jgi:hypothetical protein
MMAAETDDSEASLATQSRHFNPFKQELIEPENRGILTVDRISKNNVHRCTTSANEMSPARKPIRLPPAVQGR